MSNPLGEITGSPPLESWEKEPREHRSSNQLAAKLLETRRRLIEGVACKPTIAQINDALLEASAEIERLTFAEANAMRAYQAKADETERLREALSGITECIELRNGGEGIQVIAGSSREFWYAIKAAREITHRQPVETSLVPTTMKVTTGTSSSTTVAGSLGPPDILCPKCGEYIMNPWG